jgi:DNA primase
MNELNKISIKQYLAGMNIHPVKDRGYYGMYHSPCRKDRNASFKVDYNKNVWYDFGTNEGGSIIDLVMRLNNCSLKEAITEVNQYVSTTARQMNYSSFHRDKPFNDEPTTTIQNILPITHPKLIAWVQERKIGLNLANLYCREIHYQNRGKDYFSVGFRNDKGGYELSSPPNFKGCISPKDVTTIWDNRDTCLVFEGFWDFLSYLMLQKVEKTQHDVAVLNSVANVQKAIDFLKIHKAIYTYLDNDGAGIKATELIKSANDTVYNRSSQFAEYKDLNDYLKNKPMVKPDVKKKNLGIKR